jgi:hypothetical protein
MRLFWSVLAVMGALSAAEASAANWNEGRYASVGTVAQLERDTVWQRGAGEPEPAPIVLAKARKSAKRSISGASRTAFDGRWSVIITTRSGPSIRNIVSACRSLTATSFTRAAVRVTLRAGSRRAVPSR